MNSKNQMPRRQRDPRQVNMAIGMCIGLLLGAVGMYVCTVLGHTGAAIPCLIVCMIIGGVAGAYIGRK